MLRDEFLGLQIQYDQLQSEYQKINPIYLDLQQQLDEEKRLSKLREDELMESKRIQLEMLNAEVERYNKFVFTFASS